MNKDDFAVEVFDNEALIFRLFDKRIFRVNLHTLLLFNALIENKSNINAAFCSAKQHNPEIVLGDVKTIHRVLFLPRNTPKH